MDGKTLKRICESHGIKNKDVMEILGKKNPQNITSLFNQKSITSDDMEKLIARYGIEWFYPEYASCILSQTSTYSPTSVNGDGNVVQESVNGNNINGSDAIVKELLERIKSKDDQIDKLIAMMATK